MATKGNLLVVDDELIVRDSLDKWFREEGYDVTVAESAQDALTKMAAKRFDLALVDIKMPARMASSCSAACTRSTPKCS